MAAKSGPGRLLERAREKLVQQLDINKVLPRLLRRGIFSVSEEKEILSPSTPQQRTGVLLDILAAKNNIKSFAEFCKTLEECAPHLLTHLVLDSSDVSSVEGDEKPPPTQALQLGFELALKERDAVLRDNARAQEERNEVARQLELMRSERDQAVEQLQQARASRKSNGKEKSWDTSTSESSSSKLHRSSSQKMADKDGKPLVVGDPSDRPYEENGANVIWETHHITLHKAPAIGFGIALSGGTGSPHFANGDPAVVVSDVVVSGPAEGKLQINDRIISVNGIPLENVDKAMAIEILRDGGSAVSMIVKRRVMIPAERSNLPSKIILSKKNKKDEFGLVLGVRFFVKEVAPQSLAAHERALKEGDTILKINNTPVEGLSLADARKILDKGKDKLQLLVSRDVSREARRAAAAASYQPLNNNQDFAPPTSTREDVNVFHPSVRSEEDIYTKDPTSVRRPVPPGAYPASMNTRYDGHYVLDNDLPHPRQPAPTAPTPEDQALYPARRIDTRENFYSDWNDITPRDRTDQGDAYGSGAPDGYFEGDVFHSPQSIHERYVDMRSDIRLDPRRVTFLKDRQTGLGLRLAGGNATGIFIASVQAGSAAEREGLVEGDNILLANEKEITGLTREEAVVYLTSLDGAVSLVVQYRKEDYDTLMASHEAGDAFYIRTHFNHVANDTTTEHSFRTGDIFLVKDTLFRGVGGSWLAVHVTEDLSENKKGTIPNSKSADVLKSQQKGEVDKEVFPNRGKGSLFKRKSARRSKSLGKDHWEEVVFAGLETKFPAYERVVLQESDFMRPVVIFGAISDIARERLSAEYPERFEAPQMDKSADGKSKTAIIRLGSIREAIGRQKHCLLDVTPANVDRLNYAQFCPVAIFLKAQTKHAVKDVRSRWKTAGKNLKKLQEYNDKLERTYSHLFTGVIQYMGTEAWFPNLVEMINNQQRQSVWMSEKSPTEDVSDEFMFPMSTRLSYAAGADSDLELPRPKDDFDLHPGNKKPVMVRSNSDPSVNTHENIPGIPPYPSPPTYKNQRIPSHDSRVSVSEASQGFPPREDELMHPEDRYYPSYYTDRAVDARYAASRAHIDPYATLTPSERLRPRVHPDQFQGGGYDPYGPPYQDRMGDGDGRFAHNNMPPNGRPDNSPYRSPPSANQPPPHSAHYPGEQKGYTDNSSHSSDSYSKYVNSPQNKHDDTKLREKFGTMPSSTAGDRGKVGHDPYRFTRSTANPVNNSSVDKAKLSDLTAKYRSRQDNPGSKPSTSKLQPTDSKAPPPVPLKKKEPPPVPVKNYSLKQRGVEPDELKMRNYENSNRSYNYADVNHPSVIATSSTPPSTATPPLPPPPSSSSMADFSSPYHHHHNHSQQQHLPPPPHLDQERSYDYVTLRQTQNNLSNDSNKIINNNNNNSISNNGPSHHNSHYPGSSQQPFQQHPQGSSINDFNIPPPPPLTAASSSFTSHHPYSPHSSHSQQQQPTSSHHNLIYGQPSIRSDGNGSGGVGYDGSNPSFPVGGHDPYDSNPKAFANEVYMGHWDANRARSSHDVRAGEMGAVVNGARDDLMGEKGYRRPSGRKHTPLPSADGRPGSEVSSALDTIHFAMHHFFYWLAARTDDEQLRDLQYSRDRARSETRLGDMPRQSQPYNHWADDRYRHHQHPANRYDYDDIGDLERSGMYGQPGAASRGRQGRDPNRYRSLDQEPSSIGSVAGFTAYQKLITPGLFPSSRLSLTQSSHELRNRDPYQDVPRQYGSAFNAYHKPISSPANMTSAFHDPRPGVSGPTRSSVSHRQGHSPGSELRKPLLISPKRPSDASAKFTIPPLPLPPPPPTPAPPVSVTRKSIVKIDELLSGKANLAPLLLSPAPRKVKSHSIPGAFTYGVSFKKTYQAPSPPIKEELPTSVQNHPRATSSTKSTTTTAYSPPSPNDKDATTQTSLPDSSNGDAQSPNDDKSAGDADTPSPVRSSSEERDSSQTPPTPDTVICNPKSAVGEVTEENHTVIATAKGYFTSKGGLLESPETGVSINIPEGAIEEGKEQEIYFKVCRDNNLLPPLDTEKGETLLSPLVMCGPQGIHFVKPVELRLPHSASANPESWSFALKSSDVPTGETTEWQNMTLAGSEGSAAKGKVHQDSVSIQVDHF